MAEEKKKNETKFLDEKKNKTITVLCVICFASRAGSLSELRV